jgi:NTP pyrophosphatase (non-canonical NTP hydrolase)
MQELAKEIWEVNESKGFHNPEIYDREMAELLILSEAFEMLEAHREGHYAKVDAYKLALSEGLQIANKQDLFTTFIKNSVEDELADVVIRTLDYIVENNEELGVTIIYPVDKCNYVNHNIKELLDQLIEEYHNYGDYDSIKDLCFTYAKQNNIDLDWFIREKLEYNKTRDYLHNKRY